MKTIASKTATIQGIEITINLNERIENVRSADVRAKGKAISRYTAVIINGESLTSLGGWVKDINTAFTQTREAFEGTKWAF